MSTCMGGGARKNEYDSKTVAESFSIHPSTDHMRKDSEISRNLSKYVCFIKSVKKNTKNKKISQKKMKKQK
ncbi:hypothetical protein BpHYR1_011241 [Brachionus plicatilis]|uniref:Uncharacterized protein n=1 Tax=Brachionus plicatilis TaxID=10195 RepID=A0A3M7S5R4_BRAPC|nr:hypothetical protein BpHYR1_011241 [Brachionus plicatilis]